MKKQVSIYGVSVEQTIRKKYRIQAQTEEEALQIAEELWDDTNPNDVDDNQDGSELEKAIQLIDGRKRLYTALNFIKGNLKLKNLKQLTALNGFTFKDLPLSRQKRFKRISVRAIAVNPKSDLSVWRKDP